MKKTLITLVLAISTFTLVSCGNSSSNQDSIANKYPIEEYTSKGATLEKYLSNGTALMKDTNGENFYAGKDSTYEVVLNEKGVIMPYIIVNNTTYYYDFNSTKSNVPDDFKKGGKITIFGGDQKVITGVDGTNYNFIQSLITYTNSDDNSLIYVKYKDNDEFQVWKNYESISSDIN